MKLKTIVLTTLTLTLATAIHGQTARDSQAYTASPWRQFTDTSEMTGDAAAEWMNDLHNGKDLTIVWTREHWHVLVDTGDNLKTPYNVHSRQVDVQSMFDDGPIVHQNWILMDDGKTLLYPGDSAAFIQKLKKARRFVFGCIPTDSDSSDIIVFTVSPFPSLREAEAPRRRNRH